MKPKEQQQQDLKGWQVSSIRPTILSENRRKMSKNRQTKNKAPLIPLTVRAIVSCQTLHWRPNSFVHAHHHNVSQLIYAATGAITVNTDDGIWIVPPTRAVWVPAHTDHSIKISGQVQLQTLQFSTTPPPLKVKECRVLLVSNLLRACIIRAEKFPPTYTSESVSGHLATVIVDEIKDANLASLHLPIPTDPRAKRVAITFCNDPSNRQTGKEWAAIAGTSERTLERIFSAQTKMSFGKWQQQARLLKALEFLAEGQSTTTVAYEVGFNSPSSFSAMFKSAMGSTPSKYFAGTRS